MPMVATRPTSGSGKTMASQKAASFPPGPAMAAPASVCTPHCRFLPSIDRGRGRDPI